MSCGFFSGVLIFYAHGVGDVVDIYFYRLNNTLSNSVAYISFQMMCIYVCVLFSCTVLLIGTSVCCVTVSE